MRIKLKTDVSGIEEENRNELNHICGLIRQYVPVDMIILFGQYAGGDMRSVLGGYELLLVTRNKPVDVYKLSRWLNRIYHKSARVETKIFLHSYSEGYINYNNSSSYFFLNIRNEGILLYDNNTCRLFSRKQFKSTRAYENARFNFEYYSRLSEAFLDNARRAWDNDLRYSAAVNLGYAAELLFQTVISVFYGNISYDSSLIHHYQLSRHVSKPLARQFNIAYPENRNLFNILEKYRHTKCDSPNFSLPPKRYLFCLNKLTLLQNTVTKTCLEHLYILEKCMAKEISIDN